MLDIIFSFFNTLLPVIRISDTELRMFAIGQCGVNGAAE